MLDLPGLDAAVALLLGDQDNTIINECPDAICRRLRSEACAREGLDAQNFVGGELVASGSSTVFALTKRMANCYVYEADAANAST